jgi:arylsulfatase A-like enzyme
LERPEGPAQLPFWAPPGTFERYPFDEIRLPPMPENDLDDVPDIGKRMAATGMTDNTIIVLWADHGYHPGDKEACVKFTLWEKANRVPFIIVAPGITKPGSRCIQAVSLVDIYPALIELADLPPKDDLDGLSLVPLLRNPDLEWERPAIMTMGPGNHAVRTERWRYIHYRDGTEELYDHEKDPWEWTNLAGNPEYNKVIAEHKIWLPKE